MNVIGVRVKSTEIIYAILDLEKKEVITIDTLKIPKALELPGQLSFVRNNFKDIFHEFRIEKAGIRTMEPTARKFDLKRVQLESIIQEMFSSCSLKGYYIGSIATISAKINIKRIDFKKYIANELNFEDIENWSELTKEEREALFTALGTINV